MTNTRSKSISLTDLELQQRSQCSLYTPTFVDPLEHPAEQTLRWAVRERHLGTIREPKELRKRFVGLLEKARGNQKKDQVYWNCVKQSLPFGRRVYMFLLKYRVLHPYEPYTLQFDRGQVTGENAVVIWDKYRKGEIPMLLSMHFRRPRYLKTPNYSVLAQWLAARQDVDTVGLGIAHLPLIFGERWTTKGVNEAQARRWIDGIVNAAADRMDFPRVGSQCETCTRPCNEVFPQPDAQDWIDD